MSSVSILTHAYFCTTVSCELPRKQSAETRDIAESPVDDGITIAPFV